MAAPRLAAVAQAVVNFYRWRYPQCLRQQTGSKTQNQTPAVVCRAAMRPAAVGQAVVDFYRRRYPQRFDQHAAGDALEVA